MSEVKLYNGNIFIDGKRYPLREPVFEYIQKLQTERDAFESILIQQGKRKRIIFRNFKNKKS